MPGEPAGVAELESLLAERGEWLLRTAILLAGSQEAGKDLLQAALERVFRELAQDSQ
jgi:DNA-directed RNA polymerase specialized sigma24 family protein